MAVQYRVPLRAAEDRWPPVDGFTPPELAVLHHGHGLTTVAREHRRLLPEKTSPAPPLVPIVNHGRWLIRCPACPSAVLASRTDHRFLCAECGNAMDGGLWLKVEWPADSARIEELLGARPDRHTRNWAPPESVEDLLAENIANGVI